MAQTPVAAVGGNALLAHGEEGTYEQQRANAAAMAVSIAALLDAGDNTDPANESVGPRIIHVDRRQGALA